MEELDISNLLELEIKTQKKWDLQKLYVDLERQKIQLLSKKRLVKLTNLEKKDLT